MNAKTEFKLTFKNGVQTADTRHQLPQQIFDSVCVLFGAQSAIFEESMRGLYELSESHCVGDILCDQIKMRVSLE